jgi:acyl carrier protein
MIPNSTPAVVDRLRRYVVENYLYMQQDVPLSNDDPLLGRGIIDSMGVMEIVALLEDEFGVTMGDDEITEENLGTLNAIASFVTAKHAVDRPLQRTA